MAKNYPVRDNECYFEREAIALEAWEADGQPRDYFMDLYRDSGEAAHRTVYSRVATMALNGNWTWAWRWCSLVCERFGDEVATELMADLRKRVAQEKRWRGME